VRWKLSALHKFALEAHWHIVGPHMDGDSIRFSGSGCQRHAGSPAAGVVLRFSVRSAQPVGLVMLRHYLDGVAQRARGKSVRSRSRRRMPLRQVLVPASKNAGGSGQRCEGMVDSTWSHL